MSQQGTGPLVRRETKRANSEDNVLKSIGDNRKCLWRSPSTLATSRFFYASLLIDNGESVKVVEERLGYNSAQMTLDSHPWPRSSGTQPGLRWTEHVAHVVCQTQPKVLRSQEW
jgi:hypothetical protein